MHLSNTDQIADAEPRHAAAPVTTAQPGDELEREIDLWPYFAPLVRRWPLLLALAALGALMGFLLSGRRPVVYEASTTVLVQQAGSPAALSTARALLHNHTLAAETLHEVGLAGAPHYLTPQQFVDGALHVDEVGGTHLLNVKVRLTDPALAADASRVLSRKAVELNRQVGADGSTVVRDQLKILLDEAAASLHAAEQELMVGRHKAQLDILRRDAEVLLDSRAAYQELLLDIESEKARLSAAEQELQAHEPLLAGVRSPGAEEALRRLWPTATVESPARSAPLRPTPLRPTPGEDDRRAAPARPQAVDPGSLDFSQPHVNPIHQTLAFQVATSRIELARMERRRRELAALQGAANNRLKPLDDLYRSEIEVARLEDRFERAKLNHADVAARYEQSRTEAIGRTAVLQIVDPAFVPERPVSRKRAESMIAGALAGLLVAVVLALSLGRQKHHGAVPPRSAAGGWA